MDIFLIFLVSFGIVWGKDQRAEPDSDWLHAKSVAMLHKSSNLLEIPCLRRLGSSKVAAQQGRAYFYKAKFRLLPEKWRWQLLEAVPIAVSSDEFRTSCQRSEAEKQKVLADAQKISLPGWADGITFFIMVRFVEIVNQSFNRWNGKNLPIKLSVPPAWLDAIHQMVQQKAGKTGRHCFLLAKPDYYFCHGFVKFITD